MVLQSRRFDAWEHHLAQTLGHHRSTLLSPQVPFASRLEVWQADAAAVVAIDGSGVVRLERSQPEGRAVLWLPRQGWVAERVNGEPVLAEPGSAMPFAATPACGCGGCRSCCPPSRSARPAPGPAAAAAISMGVGR